LQQCSERLAILRGQVADQRLDLIEAMTTDGYYARFRGRCDRQLAWFVVVVPGQDGPLKRMWAKQIDQRIKFELALCGKFGSPPPMENSSVSESNGMTSTSKAKWRPQCDRIAAMIASTSWHLRTRTLPLSEYQADIFATSAESVGIWNAVHPTLA
jgi:hypothetical protein